MKGEQFEDCFEVELNIKKVEQIFFLSSHRLLVLHTPRQYTIVDVIDRNQTRVVKNGKFPFPMVDDIRPYTADSVLFVHENGLHLFDLSKGQSIRIYQIAKSSIYQQNFQFELCLMESGNRILFYKTSVLKSTPVTVYYDLHLLGEGLERVKKMKVEQQELLKFGFSCGEIFSYQTKGYTIQINFIESGITHKINSIFHLFLADAVIGSEAITLNFKQEDFEGGLSCYEVTKKKVKKLERREGELQPHVFRNQSGSRSLVYKNCFNHRLKDHFSGVFCVKATKQSKYLKMLQRVLPEGVGVQFKQQILSLLV